MKVFTISGIRLSGKTTTAVAVMEELRKRGFNVGTVKEIHAEGFSLETPGTNTDLHKRAGAQLVTARAMNETDIMFQRKLTIKELMIFYNFDYVVLEGVREDGIPKIIAAHDIAGIEERLSEDVFAISGRVSNEITEYQGIPVINPLTNITALVDRIEVCVPEWSTISHMSVSIDGKPEALSPWQKLLLQKVFNEMNGKNILIKIDK